MATRHSQGELLGSEQNMRERTAAETTASGVTSLGPSRRLQRRRVSTILNTHGSSPLTRRRVCRVNHDTPPLVGKGSTIIIKISTHVSHTSAAYIQIYSLDRACIESSVERDIYVQHYMPCRTCDVWALLPGPVRGLPRPVAGPGSASTRIGGHHPPRGLSFSRLRRDASQLPPLGRCCCGADHVGYVCPPPLVTKAVRVLLTIRLRRYRREETPDE